MSAFFLRRRGRFCGKYLAAPGDKRLDVAAGPFGAIPCVEGYQHVEGVEDRRLFGVVNDRTKRAGMRRVMDRGAPVGFPAGRVMKDLGRPFRDKGRALAAFGPAAGVSAGPGWQLFTTGLNHARSIGVDASGRKAAASRREGWLIDVDAAVVEDLDRVS